MSDAHCAGDAPNTGIRFLGAAEHLFAADGYLATAIKAIAADAGITNVHEFPTKQALT